jgi:hypothetical protein
MKRFIIKLLIFFAPIYMYVVALFIIDPYNVIRSEDSANISRLKSKISIKINYSLYKLAEYESKPLDVIILGDSRSAHLSADGHMSNLAYGGGTLQEIIDTFWVANDIGTLKEVYIGINFNLYNKNNNRNRIREAVKIKDSYVKYIFNKYSFKSTLLIINALVTKTSHDDINYEKTPLSKKEFWKYQLTKTAADFYKDYEYPDNYFNDLKRISTHCVNNNIKLIIFIPPTHVDLQNMIELYQLSNMNKKFRTDLSLIADLYDFDYPNNYTRDRNNFSDPFHFNDSIKKIVQNEIFNEKPTIARFMKRN